MEKNILNQNVLLISSDAKDSHEIEQALCSSCPGGTFARADTFDAGLDMLEREKIDIVFFDCSQTINSSTLIAEFKKNSNGVPIVIIVETGKELQAAEAMRDGAYDFIVKSDDYPGSVKRVIDRIQCVSAPEQEAGNDRKQQLLLFQQIYRSQKWWQNIIDAITDYLFVIDDNYRILRTNKAFAGLFKKEPADIIMKPYFELFDLQKPHEWCVLPGTDSSFNPRSIERELNNFIYLISCYPIFFDGHEAVVYIMKDITETRRLKDQVYHLDKLSSLGTLTSGVAHEINNPLTGIIGYTEMLLMKDQVETTKKYLQNIYDSAIRCKRMVENMLTFSRQTSAHKSPENVNNIIDKTVELHEYWLRSTNIDIVKNYSDVSYIDIDRQQMQQVILNLLINAEHAVSDCGRKGRIEFMTEKNEESNSIIVTVSDNGNGIPKEILPRIFDPFFTTKPVNKGTGLGLSIAHGIIAEQGGSVEVQSVAGEGTSFMIKLPMSS